MVIIDLLLRRSSQKMVRLYSVACVQVKAYHERHCAHAPI